MADPKTDHNVLQLSHFTIEQSPDAIFWIDSEAIIHRVNKAAIEMFGYSEEELIGKKTYQFHPQENEKGWRKRWNKLKTERMISFKKYQPTKDGRWLQIEITQNLIEFEGEEYSCSFIRNITERQQSQDALRESEEQYRNLVEMANDGIIIVQDNLVKYINPRFKKIFGFAEDDMLEIPLTDLIHPDALNQTMDQFKRHLQGKDIPSMYESALIHSDSHKVPVEFNVGLIPWKGKPAFVIEIRDITDRKMSEKTLKESEEKYRNLVEMANDGIIIIQDKIIKYVNPRFKEIAGYVPEDILNLPFADYVHKDTLSTTMERYGNHLKGKDIPSMYESALIHKNGKKVPVEFNVGEMPWQDNPALIVEIRDITKRKQAEEDLKKALQEVERLKNRLQEENIYLQQEIKLTYNFEEIISQNKEFKKVLGKVEQVASTDATVLILGETGTGKELIARAVHHISARRDRPLVKVNCAALPPNLIESELFGHERGAFTGALARKIGRFELADKGTIFLDEIGDLPMELQVKLLRVLQEGEFERLGNPKSIKVDVRVITATNRGLVKLVENGKFREDLYYRLNVFPIRIPPLRERRDDIPLLVNHFILKYGKKVGKKFKSIPHKVMESLLNYHWPGNIRELENIIERAVILSPKDHIELRDWLRQKEEVPVEDSTISTLEEAEKKHILKALELTKWRVSGEKGAARILGMNDQTLVSRMKKLHIRR